MMKVSTLCVSLLCFSTVSCVLGPRRYPLALNYTTRDIKNHGSNYSSTEVIFIGATICGNLKQVQLALMMMKSAIIFRGKLHVHFLIVCAQPLRKQISKELEKLKVKVDNKFTYELHDVFYPTENEKFLRFWFKECATERLYYPYIFKNVELMVHIDNDVLFLNELSDLWQHAHKMNQSQMLALAPDFLHVNDTKSFNFQYPLDKAPMLNAGIMIMNLRKMVEFEWFQYVQKMIDVYADILPYADQDLIRLMLLFHPDKLYPLSCRYNFGKYICASKVPCKDVESAGISILHGNAGELHNNRQFKAIVNAFQKYRIGVDPKKHLAGLLNNALKSMKNKFCGLSTTVLSNNIVKALSSD